MATLLLGHSQLEIKLDLYQGGDKVGFGSYKESTDRNGHRTREMKLWAKDDAQTKIRVFSTKVVDTNAYPISEEEQFDQESSSIRTSIVWRVRYDRSGNAIVTEYKDHQLKTEHTFPPIPGYSRADASDLWFSKVVPQPGTRAMSTVFDIEHAKWQVVETTFVGRRWITVSGRQIEANEVRDIRDGNVRNVFLDDKGQPVLMKNGPLRTEKRF